MLRIGRHVGVAMFHYFNVQDELTIGDFTTVAGRDPIFHAHYLDATSGAQCTRPIHIGEYCMLGAAVRFAPGASVPNCCVVGMGSVVTKPFTEPYCLLGGNPAGVLRRLPEDAAYFHRKVGWIGSSTASPW